MIVKVNSVVVGDIIAHNNQKVKVIGVNVIDAGSFVELKLEYYEAAPVYTGYSSISRSDEIRVLKSAQP